MPEQAETPMPGHLKLKFSILQVSYWCSFGSFTTMAVALVMSRGMSATMIGAMLTVYTVCAFAGQFFWSRLCDATKSHKKIFILTNILTLLLYCTVYFMPDFTLLIVFYGLLGFVQAPSPANLDTWILKHFHKTPAAYGPIRAAASFGFAIFILFYGKIIEAAGFKVMLIFASLFIGISVLVASLTPDARPVAHPESRDKQKRAPGLLKNKPFLQVLIIMFFIGIAIMPISQMKMLIFADVGGTVSFLGLDLFVNCMVQVPFMLMASRLARFSPYRRFLFAGIMYFIFISIIFTAKAPALIVASAAFQGIGFGILYPAARHLVFELLPPHLHTTGQGFSDAVFFNLSMIFSGIAGGAIVDNYGVKTMVLVCALVQLVPITLLVIKNLALHKQTLKIN